MRHVYNPARRPSIATEIPVNPRSTKLRALRWLPRRLMVTSCPSDERTLYLSFDDGPHPGAHAAPARPAQAHGARASFFLVGEEVEKHPHVVRRMVQEGHLIGNHSYSHPRFAKITLAEQLEEIDRTDRVLAEFDGRPRHAFRPPSGALPLPLLAHFARTGRRIVYWSYDSFDYQRRALAAIRRARAQRTAGYRRHRADARRRCARRRFARG